MDYQKYLFVDVPDSKMRPGPVSAYTNVHSFGNAGFSGPQRSSEPHLTQQFVQTLEQSDPSTPSFYAQAHHDLKSGEIPSLKDTHSLDVQGGCQPQPGQPNINSTSLYRQDDEQSDVIRDDPFIGIPSGIVDRDSYTQNHSNLGGLKLGTLLEDNKADTPAYPCHYFLESNDPTPQELSASHRHSTACIPEHATTFQYQVQPKTRFSVPSTPTNGFRPSLATRKLSVVKQRTRSMIPIQTPVAWLERSFGAIGIPVAPERHSFHSLHSPQHPPGNAFQDPDRSQAARVLASMAASNAPSDFPAHFGYATSDAMTPTIIHNINKHMQVAGGSPYGQNLRIPSEPDLWHDASPDDCQSESGSSACTEICDRPDCRDEDREDCVLHPCTPDCHTIPCTDPKFCNPKSLCTTPCPIGVPGPTYNNNLILLGMESMDMTFAQCEWALQNGHGQCNASLPNRGALGEHVLKNHIQPQLAQLCPFECGATVAPDSVTEHVFGEHQKSNYSQFVCLARGCDFIGENEADLDEHLKSAHLSKGIQCHWGDCSVTTKNPDALDSHVRADHLSMDTLDSTPSESPDTPADSLENPTDFTHTREDLKVCLWTAHGDDKPCHVVFDTGNELQAHIEAVHIKPLKGVLSKHCRWAGCERETRAFTQKEKLRIHMYTHTGCKSHILRHFCMPKTNSN